MGIASLVLSILAIIFSIIFFIKPAFIWIVLTMISLILSIIVEVIAFLKSEQKIMPIVASIVSLISVIVLMWGIRAKTYIVDPKIFEEFAYEEESKDKEEDKEIETLKLGDTWEVDGQWKLTIDSVTTTDERNEFSEKHPEQVIVIKYSYENIGFEDEDGIMDGLYFDLQPSSECMIVDSAGEVADSYPLGSNNPTQVPVGAKTTGVYSYVGLKNKSDKITLTLNEYDGKGKKHSVKYDLDVE